MYRDYPDVQLFFTETEPLCSDTPCDGSSYDVCVLPAYRLAAFLENPVINRLLLPPLIAFGSAAAMPAAKAAGCTDFLCEPWEPVEFYERTRSSFKASLVSAGAVSLICSSERRLIAVRGDEPAEEIELPPSEYALFTLFSRNRGKFFNRESIALLLGCCPEGSRAADMHVSRLRARINRLLKDAGTESGDNPITTAAGRGWGI
ncbi:MAG TPA: hypothetical protein DCO79_07170 [Spirochaeta sp.]|nr:hypothetical protein [Spirochaeta sp.]